MLSLAWVVLGYFTIFDLGLGRATTKYVAEALGKGESDQVPEIIWTAVTFQAALGFIGAIVLFGITDLLVERVLNIPPELVVEAKDTFHLLALSIPLVLVSSSFSGVLPSGTPTETGLWIRMQELAFLVQEHGLRGAGEAGEEMVMVAGRK